MSIGVCWVINLFFTAVYPKPVNDCPDLTVSELVWWICLGVFGLALFSFSMFWNKMPQNLLYEARFWYKLGQKKVVIA